jgi:tetratricopeptide (TPR) repeat protein
LKAHAEEGETIHAGDASLVRMWKRWESSEHQPDDFYKPIIARMFGTVTLAMFPVPSRRDPDTDLLTMSGMDTLELVSRLQHSDLDEATLTALRVTADRLCSDYAFQPASELMAEGRIWLRRINELLHGTRMTLRQHREVLVLAGWITLLLACVEHDTGDRKNAETTRQAALSLSQEADHGEIEAWAHEIRAWINLTSGDYRGVIAAAQAGTDAAPHHGVAVQLAAQEAKAWARIGDRRRTEVALDRGRRLLEAMPYPENTSNHFVVDPTKFDFYAMDCYRHLAEDKMASTLAEEIIRTSTDFDGTEHAPMRAAEARITLGVVAARQGDIDEAVRQGERALAGERKSVPSLLLAARELTRLLKDRHAAEPLTARYLDELQMLGLAADLSRRPS